MCLSKAATEIGFICVFAKWSIKRAEQNVSVPPRHDLILLSTSFMFYTDVFPPPLHTAVPP